MFRYKQSFDQSISDDLKKRFWKEVEVLEQGGFRFFSLHKETIWPFSVILFFPVYVLMASTEDVRVEPPLRITSYHLMYVSKDEATFAYVYGLGCKFYTKFMDGTWLVSNTAQSIRDEKVIVQKRNEDAATTVEVLKNHHAKVQELRAKGLQLATRVSFDHWVEIESRFDRSNLISVVSLGIAWLVFVVWAIYWAIMNGVNIINTIF
ncbi:MAG TPA: hypothetical protein VK253_07835 [Candidatus Binatia bacterium]|nr:hypothetical protein [Candidatus Binatia bacterium]